MNGAVGLRYESLPFMLRLEGVPRSDWPETISAVQTLELETLRLWREMR